jgi:hypothetical protein
MPESLTFCGRTFGADELELMRQMSREYSALGVTEIARTVCELLHWTRSNGGLKNHECRQLLEQLQGDGFLQLPELRQRGGRGPRRADGSRPPGEPTPVAGAARECEPLELARVEGPAESRRWREQMERYHYLGCRVPFGAHLRYWVRNRDRELACLLWTSPAWKMQARDVWIGWSDERRRHSQRAGQQNPGTERPANAARLGDSLWVSSPAAGNASGSDSFSWDMLSGCQLDLYRANRRTRAYGPRASSSWSGGQRHLCLSAGARRATAAKRQSHTVNKYELSWRDSRKTGCVTDG